MKRADIKVLPPHYDTYINKVADIEVTEALQKFGSPVILAERERLYALGYKVYAPGKWTVRDVLQHIIDCERVFAYRALRFARNDNAILHPFNENEYAVKANAIQRNMDDLLEEFYSVRASTVAMYKSFNNEMLLREGQVGNNTISVLAIGFAIAGHMNHHMAILKEKYYPLLR